MQGLRVVVTLVFNFACRWAEKGLGASLIAVALDFGSRCIQDVEPI